MAWGASMHNLLMIRPGQEVRPKTSRIHLLQGQFFLRCHAQSAAGARLINSLAIRLGGQGDVLAVLVAPFDLEARHADAHQLGYLMQGIEITR